MNAGESEVIDYIDTLLGEAQASAATPAPQATATAMQDAPPDVLSPPDVTSDASVLVAPADSVAPAEDMDPDPVPDQAPAPAPPPAASRAPAPAPAAAAEASPASAPIAPAPRWLRVLVAGASYGLELLRVQEVVRLVPIVPMRGARPAVLGVMNLRGRIVPVFDLGLWLGAGSVDPDDQSRIVVVERDDELIGVLVSAVEDVVTLGRDRIEPPLPGGAPGVILGVARVGRVPTVLFDAWALYA